jgi:2-iminoacetate synthase ThiH
VNINLAIAERARSGEALTVAEIDELGSSDVLSLGMLADEVRRARVGDTVTFTRVVEIAGESKDSPLQMQDAELRLSKLPATLDEAEGLIAEARMLAGSQLLTGFSLADVADRHWGKLEDVLRRLKRAGLDAIAEAPVDRLHDAEDALKACETAALPVRCLSLQSPIEGDGRSSWLIHLRELVTKFPKIDTVNPLSREQSIAVPTTGYEDVRAVALARLALPSVKNIQVDWAQYGPKLAQVALTFGANDLDRVSTFDDESLGKRRTSVEDVKRNIIAAGFTPVESRAGGPEGPPLR